MRALVIGASGQIGSALVRCLRARGHQVDGTHRGAPQPGTLALDVTDSPATARLIDDTRADWVFFPAGLTWVDYCEEHPDEAMRINRDAAGVAARAVAHHGGGFVYFSTEYVFDGAAGPYSEDDATHPISVYGTSKLEGERAARDANARTLVVRTTVVYGPEPQGKNFVYQLLKNARARSKMRVPADQLSSPSYNADVALATVELAERDMLGVFNIVGPEVLDRYAFARLACEVFGLDAAFVEPVMTAQLRQRAARPLRAGLRIDRVRAVIDAPLRGPADGLRAMRDALAATRPAAAS